MNLNELDNFENSLIKKFSSHQVFKNIQQIKNQDFFKILLQKRFHSLKFTEIYDRAIDGLTDKEAINVCRWIVWEEYPHKQPSHREDLFADLIALGVDKKNILNSKPSKKTTSSIEKIFSMLKMSEEQELFEIKIMATLRFWGEILVSNEYGKFIPRMERLGLTKNNSRFYWPHFEHDMKKTPLYAKENQMTHSDKMSAILQKIINTTKKADYCAQIEKKVLQIKIGFYNQFI